MKWGSYLLGGLSIIGICHGELILNGSFEEDGADGFPDHWRFTTKRSERAKVHVTASGQVTEDAPDGSKIVEFRNPADGVVDVYGSVFQHIRVEPGKRYRISFYLQGKNVNQLQLIMGKNWGVRWVVPTGNLKPDSWKFFSHEFTAEPKHIGENGDWMVRFNIEGLTTLGRIDRVSVVPVEGEVSGEDAVPSVTPFPKLAQSDLLAADVVFGRFEHPVELVVRDAAGKEFRQPLKKLRTVKAGETLRAQVIMPLVGAAAGNADVSVVSGGRTLAAGTFDIVPSDSKAEITADRNELETYETKFNTLRSRLETARKGRPDSPYLAIYTDMIPRQIAMLKRDLGREYRSAAERDYYLGIARIALPELQQLLTEMEQQCAAAEAGKNPPDSWTLLPGAITLKEGFQYAPMRNQSGEESVRPMMFGGFGHFRQVIDDLPLLGRIGANVIQIEAGPEMFFPAEGVQKEFEAVFDYFESYVEPALKRAHENGIRVALLTSTHYVPGWFRKKYPETVVPHIFMPLGLLHPKVREMQQAFLEAFTSRLAASPYRGALQSIVLSNEPTYGQCTLKREFSRNEFKKYLSRTYGSVAVFNRKAGINYASFDALIAAAGKDAAGKREFNVFKQRAFADWHRFLAGIVRRKLPEVPLHAKLMIMQTFAETELGYGYDPELFTEFCDLNGNDNGNNLWMDPAIGTEFQYSLKPVAVNNTENHYIFDGYSNPVPSEAIYTAVFQQYLYGANNLVGWVWADNPFNSAPWLDGSIMRRPANVAAHQRAVLDAVRLAPEIVGFIKYEPELAILYSPTSLILNRAPYCERIFDIYRTLAPLGYKIGFISEKQLAEKKFRNIRLLVAGEADFLRSDAAAGLKAFAARGGRILKIGDNFRFDEFGRPLPAGAGEEVALAALPDAVRNYAPPLPFKLTQQTPANPDFPVQARSAKLPDGRKLLNLINYGNATQTMTLDRPARDLITGRQYSGSFELPYKQPLLLEL